MCVNIPSLGTRDAEERKRQKMMNTLETDQGSKVCVCVCVYLAIYNIKFLGK